MIVLSNPGISCGNFKRPSSQLSMHTRFVQSLNPVYDSLFFVKHFYLTNIYFYNDSMFMLLHDSFDIVFRYASAIVGILISRQNAIRR